MRICRWLVAAAAAIVIAGPRSHGDEPPARVEQFSPRGTVKQVRQVTARFSEPMVPAGDPRAEESPFEVTCPQKGRARWIDSRNWSYDFDHDLPGGLRCRFRLRAGARTLSGRPLGGEREFSLSTGGPAIVRSLPYEGSQAIDEQQAFVLFVDAVPVEATVLANASFAVEGIPQRVESRLVVGARRDELLKTLGGQAKDAKHVVVLEAKQRFPNGAKVSLVWGRGISATTGVATDRDQTLPFIVRPAFTAEFHCSRERPRAPCIPVASMSLAFSAPIARERAKQIILTGPDGARRTPQEASALDSFVQRVVFAPPFPEQGEFRVEIPIDLRDDAGRPLVNAGRFPLAVKTGEFPPLAKFAARFGIVEWKGDATLPVTLRNLETEISVREEAVVQKPTGVAATLGGLLDSIDGKVTRLSVEEREQILPWLHRVELARRDVSLFGDGARPAKEFRLPKPGGGRPFEVVGIPFDAPGLYIVELQSERLGASLLGTRQPMYVPTAALVTNLAVHFKWGRESSLAWVTTLDGAKPVNGASVAVQDCNGRVLWEGTTDTQGIARVTALPDHSALPSCPATIPNEEYPYLELSQNEALRSLRAGLFVTARTTDDLSFVSSGWDEGIEGWRFQLPTESWQGPLTVHTVLDRSLFRAGDTVHMKHVLRSKILGGFAEVPPSERPQTMSIRHLGSEEKYDFPVTWERAGVAESTWKIPQEAKLGTYEIVFARDRHEWEAVEFRVQAFRVPLMRAILQPPSAAQVAPTEMPIDVQVQYLAGGAAAGLPVTLRWQTRDRAAAEREDYDGFTFANGGVTEGVVRRGMENDYDEEEEVEETEGASPPRTPKTSKTSVVLDATGSSRTTVRGLPVADKLQEVVTELEYRDPNGALQTVASTTPLWPSSWLVGLKPDSWMTSSDRLKMQVAVVDVRGQAVPDAAVDVDVFEQKVYSNRTRLVGGFYAYEHVEETRRVGRFCAGRTDVKGLLLCDGKPPRDGNLVLVATAIDSEGRAARAHEEVWVPGDSQWWFKVKDSDRIDVLPEKKRYDPGETARFQVRMPFSSATALISVEREGVAEAWVQELSGNEPVIEVPVRDEYAPNVFVSVMAVRGRVGGIAPTALVDLGKPAFKLGVAEVRVGWRAFELKVGVTPSKAVYRVRETAAVKIAVSTADGKPLPLDAEVAVAAVDEGLLELAPNRSWDELEAMMGRRGYGIQNATAQGQVVGKRHYGLKALPQGGGGGRQVTRELFDTLLIWKGRVPLDAHGEGAVEVPLNDSLTSFKIVAVAMAGTNRFGTGSASIRSTQDLMILSGTAPLVREGDLVRNEFTVRNTTNQPTSVTMKGAAGSVVAPLAEQRIALGPGEARVVEWPVTVPADADRLEYRVDALATSGAEDHLRVVQTVIPVVPVRTFQATLVRLENVLRQPVARPPDALPGRGGVRVTLAPRLTRSLEGVREWMKDYPYGCLEQRVSRAVALRDETLWQAATASMPAHLDEEGLLKYFPTQPLGSEVLSAYVLSVSHAAGWALPEAVEERLVEGLTGFVEGRVRRDSLLATADLSIRKMAALEALTRVGKAEPRMLSSVTLEPSLWPTSAVLDWWSVLGRVAAIPERAARLDEAEQIVRARLNLQGTTMGFSTERRDDLWWLMASADTNAVRLVLLLLEQRRWQDDVPRLVVGALARQHRGSWCCTLSNAWGVLAVEGFAQAFEVSPVSGETAVDLGAAPQSLAWQDKPDGASLFFPWPEQGSDLVAQHRGDGTPWLTLQALSAIPLREPFSSGFSFRRTVKPVEQRMPGRWSRGDVMRVRLEVVAQSEMTWVVVSDPVPAGASHLGTGLGHDSQLLTRGEERKGWVWPAFEERASDTFRAYYELVPKGTFVVEHTLRLNQSGRFQLPTTRVEALYAPEMFGEAPNASIEVEP
jgi:uncharacterized protein YfaS (alpha-2-macroglobulin family)